LIGKGVADEIENQDRHGASTTTLTAMPNGFKRIADNLDGRRAALPWFSSCRGAVVVGARIVARAVERHPAAKPEPTIRQRKIT
jgi:hypothetical protein